MKEPLLESARRTAAGPKQEGTLATRTKQDAGSRHHQLGLADRDLLDMYKTMVTARLCDEAQFRLNRQGKAPFVVPVSGHEGCQIGSAWPYRRGKDVFVPYYRDMGVCLVAGLTPRDVFLGVFGKRDDPSSGGRQMPAHWGSRRLGIVTGSSPIATQIPHAAGIAYAIQYLGEDAVVGCWFGDGATTEGDDRTYRSREEVDEARRNDPILLFGNYLKQSGLIDDQGIERLRGEVKEGIDAEVDAAWNAADPAPEDALLHVFADGQDGQ